MKANLINISNDEIEEIINNEADYFLCETSDLSHDETICMPESYLKDFIYRIMEKIIIPLKEQVKENKGAENEIK